MTSPAGPRPRALFAGLCTLDIIQSVTHLPAANEKVTALRQTVAAGGPATNAAVTFAYLGGQATLITGIGVHPLAAGIRADLRLAGVELIDMGAANTGPPPVSAILVSTGSGDRSVVSLNAAGRALRAPARLDALADRAGAVLVDAHHGDLALAAARAARARGRLCILDGGAGRTRRSRFFRTWTWRSAQLTFTRRVRRAVARRWITCSLTGSAGLPSPAAPRLSPGPGRASGRSCRCRPSRPWTRSAPATSCTARSRTRSAGRARSTRHPSSLPSGPARRSPPVPASPSEPGRGWRGARVTTWMLSREPGPLRHGADTAAADRAACLGVSPCLATAR